MIVLFVLCLIVTVIALGMLFPLGVIFGMDLIFHNCCNGPFLFTMLMIGVFGSLIAALFVSYLFSFIFAARVLKIEEPELRKAIEFIDKRKNSQTKMYNWLINVAYEKNT